MRSLFSVSLAAWLLVLGHPRPVGAGPLSTVVGSVLDPNGAAVPGASVTLRPESGEATGARETITDAQGRFTIDALEPGRYLLTASLPGFAAVEARVDLHPGTRATESLRLQVQRVAESVEVRGVPGDAAATPSRTLIDRLDLQHIPGALRAGSLAAVIDTVPSATVAHDQLHVRGSHEVGYEVDGVPVPTSALGSRLALLFDPKDVKAIEFDRGTFSAEYGGQSSGVFNIVTRSGFDQPRSGEGTLIAAQQGTVEGAASYGDHTDRLAWFGQGSANRTGLGLTPPAVVALHDTAWGGGASGKVWTQAGNAGLVTLTGSGRADSFQIPVTPDEPDDNTQAERNAFLTVRWQQAGSGRSTWSLTPYYHFSRIALNPSAAGSVTASSDDRRLHAVGLNTDWSLTRGRHDVLAGASAEAGLLRDNYFLPALGNQPVPIGDRVRHAGTSQAVYVEDRYRPSEAVTTSVGLRWDRAQAWESEQALEPRGGAWVRLPGLPFTAHVAAGRFFQAPPLQSLGVGGAQFAALGDQAFLFVRAERDTRWETGVSADGRWGRIDVTYYQTRATNYLDHEQLGASSLFLPVNLAEARLRGLEVTAASPAGRRIRARVVYAHAYAEARRPITGGLGDIEALGGGWFYLDHDERDSATAALDVVPTRRSWVHASLHYGSGFLLGDGPAHLPSHVSADLAGGFTLRARWFAEFEADNLTDRRYPINLSSEFNGTHIAPPRSLGTRLRVTF